MDRGYRMGLEVMKLLLLSRADLPIDLAMTEADDL